MPPLSLSASTSVASKSGDAGAGITTPFQYNGEFVVGGSGTTTSKQDAGQTAGSGSTSPLLYVAIGIAAISLILALRK